MYDSTGLLYGILSTAGKPLTLRGLLLFVERTYSEYAWNKNKRKPLLPKELSHSQTLFIRIAL